MKHVVRKLYWDYENEEKWLNKMAAKGMHMDGYSWGRYTFSEGEPGKYIYRLELLENLASSEESKAYIRFLEESGVEHVASYMRWVYLRKKAVDGEFEMYTDIESKMKHFKRVNTFWLTLAMAEIAIGCSNVAIAASNMSSDSASNLIGTNFIMGMLCIVLGLIFLLISRKFRKRIRMLKKDAEVHQ
ncbi:MAG: DUF2812 domain-containing protein [Eubacteriales bacterium]